MFDGVRSSSFGLPTELMIPIRANSAKMVATTKTPDRVVFLERSRALDGVLLYGDKCSPEHATSGAFCFNPNDS
jgi:hypothetical protein